MLDPIRIALLVLLLSACTDSTKIVLETRSQDLDLKATLNPTVTNFRNGGVKVSGEIEIHNLSPRPQQYSNRWLLLRSGEDVVSRAWLDNLTSHLVDTGTLEISARDTISLPVYWVFAESERDTVLIKPLFLEVDPEQR